MNFNLASVQVNIPFTMLYEDYLDRFIKYQLNPEIGLDAKALDRFSSTDFRAIAEILHRNDRVITLHGPFMDLSPGSFDSRILDVTRYRFAQLIELVPVFKPISIVCHAGYETRRYGFNKEEWLTNSLKLWTWFQESIAAYDTLLMLENVYEKDPYDLADILTRLDPKLVGFCYDIGHQTVFSDKSFRTWINVLGPYLKQMHLHDNSGHRDDHLALGTGVIDFKNIFKILPEFNPPLQIITLELHQEKDLWPSLDYLEKHFLSAIKSNSNQGQ